MTRTTAILSGALLLSLLINGYLCNDRERTDDLIVEESKRATSLTIARDSALKVMERALLSADSARRERDSLLIYTPSIPVIVQRNLKASKYAQLDVLRDSLMMEP